MTAAYLYLGLSLALLACTLAAFFPRPLRPHPASPLFFAAMIVVYFVPHVLALAALTTAVFARLGALAHPAGLAGLGMHFAACALLVAQLRRMHTSLPVLDGAAVGDRDHPFTDELDPDARRALAPGAVSWASSVTYRTPAMAHASVTRSVVFRAVGRARLKLDVYRPRHPPRDGASRPTLMYIHGGGWVMGTRRQSRFMMYELAAAGYVVFAVSYRFAPWHPLPAAIEDCKAAAAWVREHAHEYGADPRELVVLGGSAGGHLTGMLALTPNDPRFQPGFEDKDTRIQGAVLLYPMPDFVSAFGKDGSWRVATFLERVVFRARFRERPELFHAAQPATYVTGDAPPMLLVHGTHDHLIPIEQSRRFVAALRSAGARRVHLLEVPAGQHAFEVFPSPLHQRAVRVVLRFLASLRTSPQSARRAA